MAQDNLNLSRTHRETVIPIVCQNPACQNHGRCVNAVTGIAPADMDLFYCNYDGGEPADYCPVCGEWGVAEDPVVARICYH